jgi:hypothetical protein
MNAAVEPIDGGKATLAELRRAGIDAPAALGPVGMARFLQQFDPGQGDYTAERSRILGNPVCRRSHRRNRAPTYGPTAEVIAMSGA